MNDDNKTEPPVTPDPNDILILPLRNVELDSKSTKKEKLKKQLDEGFTLNFSSVRKDPDKYVERLGDQIMLVECNTCQTPMLLHVTKPNEPCKLEPLSSQTNHALMTHLDATDSFKMIKGIADARHKDKELYVAQLSRNTEKVQTNAGIPHQKRPKIPDYTPDTFDHWAKMIKTWDGLYPNVPPLEKYFELMGALKGEGETVLQKLHSEGLDYTAADIVELCLKKIESYLEKTELTRISEVNQKYREISRGSTESTNDYTSRFQFLISKQKEVGLHMCEKQHAIDMFQNANLDANAKNIVASQVDFTSKGCLDQLIKALGNVTPNASGVFFNERGRSRQRGNNRNRSKSMPKYSIRCPCPFCKAHDRDYNELYLNNKRSASNDTRSSERRYQDGDNSQHTNNSGNTYCITSAYLNAFDKQIIIDTGCVPSLMSIQDVPYLESLIGRKLKPTGYWLNVRFGDGKPNRTESVVKVPFWDGSKTIEIDVGIVKDRIPFLLGMSFLRNVSKNMIIDDKVELKGGAIHPVIGDGRGHMKLEWSRELHCGSEKVSNPDIIHTSHFVEPVFSDFFDDEGVIAFKAEVTVNTKDLLLDDESSKYLEKCQVLSRRGYCESETDAVYLYTSNQFKNLEVRNPYEYSDLGFGIMRTTHDRGFRDGIDLEEEIEEKDYPEINTAKVSFNEVATQRVYDKYEPSTQMASIEFKQIKDKSTSYYSNMTRKSVDITLEKDPKTTGNCYLETRPANRAVPIDYSFHVRSSGQITYLENDETVEGSGGKNFYDFIRAYFAEKETDFDESCFLNSKENVYSEVKVPQIKAKECYSNKQLHDAQKKKAAKKKAVRGLKKDTQNLKPDVSIPGIKEAMDVEIEKFKNYKVFEEVEDSPYLYKVPSNWVITKKDSKKQGSETFKARLVALGNLDRRVNLSATDSPTLSRETMRILLSTIANLEFQLQGCDVSSAFLQGAPLDRTVYMNPPKQYRKPGKVWLLKKPVYGLADSGRLWYKRLREEILRLGCKELTGDGACFHMSRNGQTIGLLGAHVDDLIYGGTPEFEEIVIKPLMETFNISKTDYDTFVFCGMTLRQSSDKSITVSQKDYSQTIDDLPDYSKMTEQEKVTLLKSVAGQVMYLSLTRPDLMFDSSELLRVGKTTDERLKLAEKLLQKVKNGNGTITFKQLGPIDDLELMVYSDASYNNIKYGKVSTAGTVILLKGKNGNCAPIQWVSKPIIRVTRSTMAAEARALELAADYAVLFSRQIKEIYTGDRTTTGIPVKCHTDSHTLHDAVVSSRQVEEKSLVHLIYCLKDKLLHSEIQIIKWVNTHNMLADGLTKSGVKMEKLMRMIETGLYPSNWCD